MISIVFLALVLDIEDSIFNWVFTHIPTIGTSIFLVWLTWWFRGRFIQYRDRFVRVETGCGQLDNNQIALNRRLNNIDSKLNTLIIHLSATKKIDSNLFRSQSPIELTETGTKILNEMGGKIYIDVHLPALISQMENQDFKSGLDVQNYCSVLLNERVNDDALVPVKDYISRTPMCEVNEGISVPLDITVAITIMGIYLRNRYFDKHPDLRTGLLAKRP